MGVAYFNVSKLSQHSPGETEEEHDALVKIANSPAGIRAQLSPEGRRTVLPLHKLLGSTILKWAKKDELWGFGQTEVHLRPCPMTGFGISDADCS